MQDSILAVATDAISIISAMGRNDVSNILLERINTIMGWSNEQK